MFINSINLLNSIPMGNLISPVANPDKMTTNNIPKERVCEKCPNTFFAKNKYCALCQDCVIKERSARKELRTRSTNSNTSPVSNPNPIFIIPAFDHNTKHCVAQTNENYNTIPNHIIRVVFQFETDYYFPDGYGGCDCYSFIVRTLDEISNSLAFCISLI